MCAASAASASVVSLWMHDAPSGVGVGWVVLSTRYHVCTNSRPLAGVFHHHYRGAPRAEEGRRLNAPQCTTSHRLITPPTIRARESSAIVGEHEQVYLPLAAVIGSTAQHPVLGGPLHRQLPALATRDHPSETQRQASGVRRQAPRRRTHCKRRDNNALPCVTKHRIALPLARTPEAPHYWERRLISCFCFASHVGHLFRWAPGTRSALTGRRLAVSFPAGRDAVKARDALLGQCPLGQPRGVRRRGYSPTDTAHEMRIPLRPLRMSKPYRRLRKRRLRSD